MHTSVLLRLAAFLLRRIIGADLAEGYGNPPGGVHRVLRKKEGADLAAPQKRPSGLCPVGRITQSLGDARNLSFSAAK